MELNKQNLLENIDQIQNIIKDDKTDFISIDLEMTGIVSDEYEYKDDLPMEYYYKKRKVAMKYNILQVGITVFHKNDDGSGNLTAYPYNAFVFPKENQIYNPSICLQLGGIEFNCKHNMDYNKWIYEGIPYVQNENKAKLQEKIIQESPDQDKMELEFQSQQLFDNLYPELQVQCKDGAEKLMKWYNNPEQKEEFVLENIYRYQKGYFTAFQEENLPLVLSTCVKSKLIYKKCTPEEKLQELKRIYDESVKLFKTTYGFTQVMEFIWDRKVPVVGHNCYMDFLFLYQTFNGLLPADYNEYKKQMKEKYSALYDTKQIMKNFEYKQPTTLEYFEERIKKADGEFPKKVDIKFGQGFQKYDFKENQDENKQNSLHEAGYDSYLTGWIFAQMRANLENDVIKKDQSEFYLMRSNYQVNLLGDDKRLTNSDIFVAQDPKFDKASKSQSPNAYKKVTGVFDKKFYGNSLKIRTHEGGAYYMIEFEEGKDEEVKAKFIKDVTSLKAEGFQVRSYADYCISRKQKMDAFLKKNDYNNQ